MTELTPEEIIRAWKDEEFRNSLTAEQLEALPPTPSDLGELSDEELESVAGGKAIDICWCASKSGCTRSSAE